jgi:hypothetical protein
VRDLKGNLLSDKMVGHIFQVEDGLVKRFDIRGSGENQGQSTRDLGGYSRRATPARSFPDTDRTLRRTLHQSHRYDLAGKKHIACCRLSGNCLKLGTLAAQNGCGSFGTNHTALWRSKCSVFIEGAAKSR